MRSRKLTGRISNKTAMAFHHELMEAFELLEILHEHGVTGPVSRASLPGIYLSGLTPDLHPKVHKELAGKVDFYQASGPVGWEDVLLRRYASQATLEERKDPTSSAAREISPLPLAIVAELLVLAEADPNQCQLCAVQGAADVEGRQMPGASVYTGCRKCKSKDHLARDCTQQHNPQQKAGWVKCIWEDAIEVLQNSNAGDGVITAMWEQAKDAREQDFVQGGDARTSASPARAV
ncbi:hypothetical protein CYMTET_18084 [Cymbomonas tetramitiformis]|uniref:CCHC-type domain-containing protein n=1 Tax=Cymbomonas tetramitiformis TaxID=36881 RepID=A0AAE0G901_9CHLO|nr:hypothetical protein CYMTET_18084 [Cymbomonas tetramitiformis]